MQTTKRHTKSLFSVGKIMNRENKKKSKKSHSSTNKQSIIYNKKVTIEIWMIYKDYVYNRLFLVIKAIFCNIYAFQIRSHNINQTDRIILVYHHTRNSYIHEITATWFCSHLKKKISKWLRLYFISNVKTPQELFEEKYFLFLFQTYLCTSLKYW